MTKTLKEWEKITEILKEHSPYPGRDIGEKLCFFPKEKCPQCISAKVKPPITSDPCPHMDYDEVTNRKLAVDCEQYNLIKEQHPKELMEIQEEVEDEFFDGSHSPKEEIKKSSPENDIKFLLSKEERNTMVTDRKTIEENKEALENFRSFNDFSTKYVNFNACLHSVM